MNGMRNSNTTKDFFGTEGQELIDIYEEWSVQYNTADDRFTDSFNELNRWQVRHRFAPYQGVDEHGVWFDTFTGNTLVVAVRTANEYLTRAQSAGEDL